MAVLSVILSLFVLMLITSCYCAPDEYGFYGTFGVESQLNLTGKAYGTLKQKNTGVTGDVDGAIGAKWNGKVYGGGVANINDNYVGGTASVSKTIEGSIRPGAYFETGLDGTGIIPRLGIDTGSKTTYDVGFVTGDNAKLLARSYGADVQVNLANGTFSLSSASAMFYIVIVVRLIKFVL